MFFVPNPVSARTARSTCWPSIRAAVLPKNRVQNASKIGVIDIFAGPGGLSEGFSSFSPTAKPLFRPFQLAVSAEMERSAHATLRLRAFFRKLQKSEGDMPSAYTDYLRDVVSGSATAPEQHFGRSKWRTLWEEAETEALHLTMGEAAHDKRLHERIKNIKAAFDRLVLIGGPPCQAYSLVGRARQRNVKGFASKGDHRHFLYREYLEILAKFSPDVFIMENVKGILTSTVGKSHMFTAIHEDLSNPSRALGLRGQGQAQRDEYLLLPVHVENGKARCAEDAVEDPSQFIIRCENHGIPQARHRVIIMGVRADQASKALAVHGLESVKDRISFKEALGDLPRLRSGISYEKDDPRRWSQVVNKQRLHVVSSSANNDALRKVRETLSNVVIDNALPRSATSYVTASSVYGARLRDSKQPYVLNHNTRGHMAADLGRYLFCAAFGLASQRSPSSPDFPTSLSPDHANWLTGAFSDRFRVQLRDRPAHTITSHLSKDGHAFIHWDPSQCRSISVREAARLQSFPDDYLFLGNRSQQFVQVGNAVPPLIARQIARVVWSILKDR